MKNNVLNKGKIEYLLATVRQAHNQRERTPHSVRMVGYRSDESILLATTSKYKELFSESTELPDKAKTAIGEYITALKQSERIMFNLQYFNKAASGTVKEQIKESFKGAKKYSIERFNASKETRRKLYDILFE